MQSLVRFASALLVGAFVSTGAYAGAPTDQPRLTRPQRLCATISYSYRLAYMAATRHLAYAMDTSGTPTPQHTLDRVRHEMRGAPYLIRNRKKLRSIQTKAVNDIYFNLSVRHYVSHSLRSTTLGVSPWPFYAYCMRKWHAANRFKRAH